MPRLNLSMSENFSPSARTQPGGRRVRSLNGVEVAEERSVARGVVAIVGTAAALLGIGVGIAWSPSILRLLHLSH